MRPRLEGIIEQQLIQLLACSEYEGLNPTKVLEKLIKTEFDKLYPSEVSYYGNTEEDTKGSNPHTCGR